MQVEELEVHHSHIKNMNSSILELLVFLILLQNCNASSFYEIPLDKIVDPNIHYKWRDLTYTELKEWYSPTELCMLDTNDTVLYPMKIREKYCEKLGKPRGAVNYYESSLLHLTHV